MKEETNGLYGKPKFGLIVVLFGVALIVLMVATVLFLKTGHPVFHPTPQPQNNKGSLVMPRTPQAARLSAATT